MPPWDLDADVDDTDGPWHLHGLKLNRLHETGLDGSGVKVAVIDSGVEINHPDFTDAQIDVDFVYGGHGGDSYGHGTSMIGVIVGAAGPVAPRARILSVRATNANGDATSTDLANAISLSVKKGADVISVSIIDSTPEPKLVAAVEAAIAAGRIVVAAAGNDRDGSFDTVFPASLSAVIAVTAIDDQDELVYVTPPAWVDLAAPGKDIFTATLDAEGYVTGSSPATAIVAGVCALLLGMAPDLKTRRALAKHLLAILRETARTLPSSTGPGDCGGLQVLPAVKAVKAWLDQQ